MSGKEAAFRTTECNRESFLFQPLGRREVVGQFDGGKITSDAGALLLRETERITGILRGFAACFTDHRDPDLIEHTVPELVAQRVYGLCLGYEDLNDHDQLRHDPLLAVRVGKPDPTGEDRLRKRDQGKALAGKSTQNRLELTPVRADKESRYKKITVNRRGVQDFIVEAFLQAHDSPPPRFILDLDALDLPLHGDPAGRFIHGNDDPKCDLPLSIICGDHQLSVKLRPSNLDAEKARSAKSKVSKTTPSGASRFRTSNFEFRTSSGRAQAKTPFEETGKPARGFKDFHYATRDTWSCERRVIGKAEHLDKGFNPRFVVTSLPSEAFPAPATYEEKYCARGDMENRLKEQQLGLFADRTSAATMWANELRLWFSAVGYGLMTALRRLGLQGTELAAAQCDTIRLKLFKIGARIRVTVRKVWVSLAESFPDQDVFRRIVQNLIHRPPFPLRC